MSKKNPLSIGMVTPAIMLSNGGASRQETTRDVFGGYAQNFGWWRGALPPSILCMASFNPPHVKGGTPLFDIPPVGLIS